MDEGTRQGGLSRADVIGTLSSLTFEYEEAERVADVVAELVDTHVTIEVQTAIATQPIDRPQPGRPPDKKKGSDGRKKS
jgi:hypothetical protein